jgi:small subunit ribosomal protein S20
MPNTKSAKKRLKQNHVRRMENRSVKSAMRGQIRRVREAVDAGDIEKAETEFRVASKRLDRAGSKNLIHPNKAARTKSRLQGLIKRAKTSAAEAAAAETATAE